MADIRAERLSSYDQRSYLCHDYKCIRNPSVIIWINKGDGHRYCATHGAKAALEAALKEDEP